MAPVTKRPVVVTRLKASHLVGHQDKAKRALPGAKEVLRSVLEEVVRSRAKNGGTSRNRGAVLVDTLLATEALGASAPAGLS